MPTTAAQLNDFAYPANRAQLRTRSTNYVLILETLILSLSKSLTHLAPAEKNLFVGRGGESESEGLPRTILFMNVVSTPNY